MVNSKKLKTYFLLVYCVLFIATLIGLNSIKNNNIENHFEEESKQFELNYKVIYNDYKNMASMIFETHIQDDKVLDLFATRNREALEEYLTKRYKKLRTFNIRQLHFHLPNNDSFLRMHRPNKFGDNLTKARKTVAYVNENKKFIDGFEEGKIFNGFRFVYPVTFENKYIGSVEVSFSALFFIQEISNNYNVTANFLINKDVVDEKVFKDEKSNYMQSPLDGYYYQKSVYEKLKLEKYNRKIDNNLKNEILKKMKDANTFSIYVEEFDEVATFIPLLNPITKKNVAYLKINKLDSKVKEINSNFLIYFILLNLLILVVLIYLYSQFNYQHKLEEVVSQKTKSLNKLNKNLEKTIQKEVSKNREKDELIIAQSRNAAMGEMISMIAHQWRQPLTTISMDVNNILADIELESLNENELKNISKNIIERTQYLSKTIEDFRNFFKPEKTHEKTDIKKVIQEAVSITNASLNNNSVILNINCSVEKSINTYSREVLQVLINIIKNAKEALEDNPTENRLIEIKCSQTEEYLEIRIFNNGNKIPEDILEKIFDPYFSTKKENIGTGLGLYMSKIIIEKHLKGSLEAFNVRSGVEFVIVLPFNVFKEN